ncbi:hypothetical protein [Streptomyces sp. KMM 9044]|uniref:hypothetical protein n=1 Tax=Streptomyces sp. KMM 9044 TaxID=2744474 RepID=UPI002151B922|nr:hypothetical protein [Streptomyces sp. KMM 9044]WAX80127.1 hypothetical protein HUV60_023175 [Streptomyces sp. KMM 9044]
MPLRSDASEEVTPPFVELGHAPQATGPEAARSPRIRETALRVRTERTPPMWSMARRQVAHACSMLPRLRSISALATRSRATIRA